MEILELLYKKHKVWISHLISLGCPTDLSEDIVMEMYIKIDAYLKKTGNDIKYNGQEINVYFVYLTLRSLFYDYKRKSKNFKFVDFEDWMLEDILSEDEFIDSIFDEEAEEMFNKSKSIEDWYNDDLYLSLLDENIINEKEYTRKDLERYYLRRIFKEVFYDKTAISKLSKETKITYWSLRNTINIIKKQIRKHYETRRHTSDDI